MTAVRLAPCDLREITQVVGPVEQVRVLSCTNNLVVLVKARDQFLAVRKVTDRTCDPEIEQWVGESLSPTPLIRQVIWARSPTTHAAGLAIAAYLPGKSLADVLPKASADSVQRWARQILQVLELVASLPAIGFGTRRNGSARHDSLEDFLGQYLRRQFGRSPRMEALFGHAMVQALDTFTEAFASCGAPPVCTPGDVNLRNFVVRPSGDVCLINIPMIWHTTLASPVGELSTHSYGTELSRVLADSASMPQGSVQFFAAFHAFAILCWVERRHPTELATMPPWGGSRPLVSILSRTLRDLGIA